MTPTMWFVLAVILIPLLLVMFNRWRMDVAALVHRGLARTGPVSRIWRSGRAGQSGGYGSIHLRIQPAGRHHPDGLLW